MLDKEEIEKVKRGLTEELNSTIKANECGLSTNDFSRSIKILEGALQYIDQLENENKRLTHTNKSYKGILNKLNKIIDEMASELADYVMYYDYSKCRDLEMIKYKANEIKQYFEEKVEEK